MSLNASSLHRVAECTASVVLPQAPFSTQDAIDGKHDHADIEHQGVPEQVADLFEGADSIEHEVAFVLNVEKRIVIRCGIGRASLPKERKTHEIAVIVDVIAKWTSPRVLAADWKNRLRVAPARHNLQMLCASLATDATQVALIYRDDWSRDVADVTTWPDERWRALSEIVGRYQAALSTGEIPTPRAGPWCQYCNALPNCPTQRAQIQALARIADIETAVANMTDEQVGEVYAKLAPFEDLIERGKRAIRLRAEQRGVPLPNGKLLVLREYTRSTYDAEGMRLTLSLLGEDVEQFKKTSPYTKLVQVKGDAEKAVGT